MSDTPFQQVVAEIIATSLGVDVDKVVGTARFVDDLGGDSLDFVEILFEIETRLEIAVEDGVAAGWVTVQDALDGLAAAHQPGAADG